MQSRSSQLIFCTQPRTYILIFILQLHMQRAVLGGNHIEKSQRACIEPRLACVTNLSSPSQSCHGARGGCKFLNVIPLLGPESDLVHTTSTRPSEIIIKSNTCYPLVYIHQVLVGLILLFKLSKVDDSAIICHLIIGILVPYLNKIILPTP